MAADTSLPTTLLRGDVLRRLPIDLGTAESLGPITEVWVNVRHHRVVGLGCGGGLGRRSRRFDWGQVVSVGHDGLVLRTPSAPDPTQFPQDDTVWPESFALGEVEIWSDHGDRLGDLIDYAFAPRDGTILQYHFTATTAPGLAPGRYAISPEAVISLGRQRMMVAQAALAQAERLGDPVPPRASGLRSPLETLPLEQVFDHIPDPKQTWEATVDRTRQARSQLSEQWQGQGHRIQSEAQQRIGQWLGDVKKRTRHLRHQLRETVSDVTAGLPSPPQRQNDTKPTIDVDATAWPEDEDTPPPRP